MLVNIVSALQQILTGDQQSIDQRTVPENTGFTDAFFQQVLHQSITVQNRLQMLQVADHRRQITTQFAEHVTKVMLTECQRGGNFLQHTVCGFSGLVKLNKIQCFGGMIQCFTRQIVRLVKHKQDLFRIGQHQPTTQIGIAQNQIMIRHYHLGTDHFAP